MLGATSMSSRLHVYISLYLLYIARTQDHLLYCLYLRNGAGPLCVGGTNPTTDSLIILLEPSVLYKPGARLHVRLNAGFIENKAASRECSYKLYERSRERLLQ